MPKKKIDDASIIAAYDDLQNGRAVARLLNVHEQTVYQVMRRSKRVCLRCGGAVVAGKASCKECLEFDRARMKETRRARRRDGLCQQCGEQRSPISLLFCEKHRMAAIDRNARHKAKLKAKRGAPNSGVQNTRQKRRSLLGRYGQGAIECWDEGGGKCEVCAISYEEKAIHVHHIDEDRTNNVRGNFACLCFDCHNATHSLLNSRNRVGLLDWFGRAYPDKPLRVLAAS